MLKLLLLYAGGWELNATEVARKKFMLFQPARLQMPIKILRLV